MIDLALATAAITAATAGVGLIDKIADQIDRFLTKKPEPEVPPQHRLKIERDGDAIVSRYHGQESQRITAADLQKLPEAELRHIKVFEQSMENHYAVWEAVHPQQALAVDPVAKAKIDLQLKGIIRDMKRDLNGILGFLERIGLNLDDHYMHIRDLVANV
jgi:hypothetical protein